MRMISVCLTGMYLLVMAVMDKKTRKIPILPGILCMILICILHWAQGQALLSCLTGAVVGVMLYLISKLSNGGVGEGDAFVYVVTGITLGFFKNLELLIISLLLAAVVGLVLVVIRRVGRKYTLPFVPFTALAYGLVIWL